MTGDLPPDLDVDYEITRFIRRVRVRSLQRIAAIHPKLDYGSFLFLLAICDAKEGIRGSELAEALEVHKSTASRAIASLERLGLIRRVPDPEDGRAQLLVAEAEALGRVDAYRQSGHAALSEVLSGWDADEVTSFARSLTRLNDAFERMPMP